MNQPRNPTGGAMFKTVNPATGEVLKNYSLMTDTEVDKVITSAFKSYTTEDLSVNLRAQMLSDLAKSFRQQRQTLAVQVSSEMGKPLKDSSAEVEKCALAFDYFSQNLESFLASQDVPSDYKKSKIVKDAIGPILSVMPWNFPLWQLVRFAAPAVGIGNPILLKHSEVTAGTAKLLQEIFNGVSKNLLFNLTINHDQAALVIRDPRVRAVTLTGSTKAGRAIAKIAGENLKKSVLELGGSDAYVVFANADLAHAAKICAQSRMVNNGQSCVAAKRFLIEKPALDQFIELFKAELRTYIPGNPLKSESKVGSLAAKKFQTQLLQQCDQLLAAGQSQEIFNLANEITTDHASGSAFFAARAYLVSNTEPKVFTEEFFGPVALLQSFNTAAEALDLVNRSDYGLGGAVFSSDQDFAENFARKMEAGFVAINDMVKSAPNLPFGGVKQSGYGRELGLYGFNEFCNVKTLGFY